jgi:hypothetical protein
MVSYLNMYMLYYYTELQETSGEKFQLVFHRGVFSNFITFVKLAFGHNLDFGYNLGNYVARIERKSLNVCASTEFCLL